MSPPFALQLGADVRILASGETGTIIARSESSVAENQYMVRYRDATGRAIEAWWGESALEGIES